jgi:hypothetical protein
MLAMRGTYGLALGFRLQRGKNLGRQSFLDQRIFKLLEIGGRVATEATP